MPIQVEVHPFRRKTLARRIAKESKSQVTGSGPADYLDKYAATLGCKTMVIEREYVDGDYLDDFAAYYSRCFDRYKRRCSRIHLFASSIREEQLLETLLGGEAQTAEELQDRYLGFIVVRPLPNAPIGRTALSVFPPENGRRQYRAIRKYRVSLFGIPLEVESLAYQQQDSVVAACATVALWCAFHGTSQLFHSSLPRPAEITKIASHATSPGRVFPNHGLDLRQICDAVRATGIEPELFSVDGTTQLPSLLYAHLAAHIPVIVCAEIEGLDHHAFTLTGWSIQNSVHTKEAHDDTCIPMLGRRISAFYAHDDQIGPFARLDVGRGSVEGEDQTIFEGTWQNDDGSYRRIIPWAVVVPVYNKIRVNFIDIQEHLLPLQDFFDALTDNALAGDCEWDVTLSTVNDYKERVRANPLLSADDKQSVLLASQPKFIWKANLGISGHTALQLLADATGVRDDMPFIRAVWYDTSLKKTVRNLLKKVPDHVLDRALGPPLLEFLRQATRPSE